MRSSDLLAIGEISARSGVAPSALRFWEDRGLIATVRDGANHRRYERSVLRRIAFIRSAARVGLTLEEIATALATLPSGRTPTRADWARLSALWRHRIEDQIARLEHLRDDLDTCIGCGCLSLDRCALANPGDRRAEEGPGAPGLEP